MTLTKSVINHLFCYVYIAVICNFILDDFSQKFQIVGRTAQISERVTPPSIFT